MSHRADEHHHRHDHNHPHHQTSWCKRAHKDWRTWVVIALMLGGMVIYILSNDESLLPGGGEEQEVPAAP